MRRRSQSVCLSLTEEVREITVRAWTRDRSAITSSINPSAKYALSGSGLRLANGSTTMAFFGAAAGRSGASSAARKSSTVANRSAGFLHSARSIARRTGAPPPHRPRHTGPKRREWRHRVEYLARQDRERVGPREGWLSRQKLV